MRSGQRRRNNHGSHPGRSGQAFQRRPAHGRRRDDHQGLARPAALAVHRDRRQRAHLQPRERRAHRRLLRRRRHLDGVDADVHAAHRHAQDHGRRRGHRQLPDRDALQPPGPRGGRRPAQGEGRPPALRDDVRHRRRRRQPEDVRRPRQADRPGAEHLDGRQRRLAHAGQARRARGPGEGRQAGDPAR